MSNLLTTLTLLTILNLRTNLESYGIRSKPAREIEFSQTALIEQEHAKAEQSETMRIGTTLAKANLREAKFDGAVLIKVDLHEADLRDANIQQALTLVGTDLRGVTGLDEKQLEACANKGAITDKAPTTSPP